MCKSYNFWQNKLMVMKIDEYNSEGAARAVVDALVDTLGFSRVRLSNILCTSPSMGCTQLQVRHVNKPSTVGAVFKQSLISP